MCGILGIVKKNSQVDFHNFQIINRKQSHRGPDDEGYWLSADGRIAFGQTRLSIIDLAQGKQPITDNKNRATIIYNGEIYNYRELKDQLEIKGYVFRTASDTEVVLNSYLEWGEDCVNRFRGMFAFAIVNTEKGEIFLARDAIGIKPLVYYFDDDLFCFASEINTLTKIKNLKLDLDYKAIDIYLWLQYIPAPITVFNKVKKLEPGHIMTVDISGSLKTIKRYWRPCFKPDKYKKTVDWEEDFEKTVSDSVKLHTVADVTYGAFLSGGLDSSLIVKYLTDHNQARMKSFSIGFEEEGYNELKYAKIASEKYGTDHYSYIMSANDYLSQFEKLVGAYGEPFGDSSALPTYYVSKLASDHVKVVLSGDGGDELFAGYDSYQVWRELKLKKKNRSYYMNFIYFWLSLIRPQQFTPEKQNLDAWLNIISYYNLFRRKNIWKEEYKNSLVTEYKFFDYFKKDFESISLVNKAQLFDITNYLPFDILTKVDIASMLNNLETRVPFIDRNVIDLALSIPEEVNYNNENKWEGKKLMKKILGKDFSKEYTHRKKQGFGVPLDHWFGENGLLYNEPYMRLINSRSKIFRDIFNLKTIYERITCNEHHKTYLLLVLEEWLYQFENIKDRILL